MNTKLIHIISAVIVAITVAAPSFAQDLTHKAAPLESPVALVNANLVTMTESTRDGRGYVLIGQDGIIQEVGIGERVFIATVRQIDCQGAFVYPGLIGANTRLGLTEIGAVRATHDYNEVGRVTPEVRAVVAVNPDSTLIPVTRSNGILSAAVFPSGGVIPGRASVIQLEGWTWEDMTVADDAGLVVNWPLSRVVNSWWMDKTEEEQLEDIRLNAARIRSAFAEARAYLAARDADPSVPIDLRYEAMRAALEREKPVFISAQDYEQIVAAVAFANEQALDLVIVGGRDSHLCTDLLVQHNVGVILNGVFSFPKRDDSPFDDVYRLPLKLEEAGVRWCMASGTETAHERNLPYAAAMAVAHGLPMTAGLESITIRAADVLGVADKLGTIEAGKHATLIVTDGNPLEVTTSIERAFIMGREIDLSNKQTKLNEKYRAKYRQLGEIGN